MSLSPQELRRLYKKHKGIIRRVAHELDMPPQTLAHRLIGLGIHKPKERMERPNVLLKIAREETIKARLPVTVPEVIIKLHKKYRKVHVAAKAIGVSQATLSRLCTYYGQPWRVLNDKKAGVVD